MNHEITNTTRQVASSARNNNILTLAACKYGNDFANDFLPSYPTKNRGLVVKSLRDAVRKDSLSLVSLDNKYPNNPSLFWLKYQLIEVFSFCGVYKKLTEYQIKRTAELIRHEYYWITVTELMEFFTKFEAGKYSKMYGYNPQDLMQSLALYAKEVLYVRGIIEDEKAAKRMKERQKEPTMSYKEYCERKGKKPEDLNNLIKKV